MATAAAAELVAASERAKALAAAVPVVLGQTGGQGHDDAAAESEMADSSSEVEEEAPTQPQPVEMTTSTHSEEEMSVHKEASPQVKEGEPRVRAPNDRILQARLRRFIRV